jgi:hypothetical protein
VSGCIYGEEEEERSDRTRHMNKQPGGEGESRMREERGERREGERERPV